ncbi:MAG: GEVED domain-containing protein [Ignavibacteria bacterium]|nr:GEVED domain-containing protein [Ignavibacteria bacterium]
MKNFWIMLIAMFLSIIPLHTQFYISQNANVYFGNNIVVQINTDLTLANGSNLTQNGTGTIYITGNWTNNGGTFNPGNGLVIFVGSGNSTIGGTSLTNFYNLTINKNSTSQIVLIDYNTNVSNNLQVQQGILRLGNSNFVRLIIYGDATVASNGIFDVINSLPNAFDTVKFGGNLYVNGSLDFNTTNGKTFAFFIGSGNVEFDGTGTANFFEVLLRKANKGDTVFFKKSFSAPNGFLTLDTGFFKIVGNFSLTNTFLKPQTGNGNCFIQKESGFWLANPNVTVQAQPLQGNLYLRGDLVVSNGTFNVGSTGQSSIIYDNSTPAKSKLDVRGGQLNVWTRISPQNYGVNLIDFAFSGGTINIGTGTNSTETSVGAFDISASGSSVTWSGGTLELRRTANNSVADYVVLANTHNVTGGMLKINSAATGQTFDINSTVPVYDFEVVATNDPIARLVNNNLTVLNNLTFAGSGSGRLNANNLNITLGGNWTNNCSSVNGFTPGNGTVILNGSSTQTIGGTQSTSFNNLSVNKTGGQVEVDVPIRVDGNLRLLSNTLFDLNSNNLTIGPNGHIYSDNGTSEDVITFNSNKYIVNSGSGGNPLGGAKVIKEIPSGASLPLYLYFPVGTPGYYSPAVITFNLGGATFGANPYVSVKPVPVEHPEVETNGKSLTKYWAVDKNDVTVNNDGASVKFYYNAGEVQGNEVAYVVLWYNPPYNDPSGYWRINPGVNNYVDFNNRLFYSLQVDEIKGDWVAGEQEATVLFFFARANGNFNSSSTWSNIDFGGPASTKIPSKKTHKVRIQDYTVTITADVPELSLISVENGTSGRQPGKLAFTGNYIVQGDTFRLEQNTTLYISHTDGISPAPNNLGSIRTTVRDLSSSAVYIYTGTGNQVTGDGIPNVVRGFVVDKPTGQVLTLSKSIQISDSLVINNGVLDLSSYSINGQSSGRTLIMRGGEMIIRQAFPLNYTPPTFSAGRITFDGTGNVTIPSSSSNPAVNRYYDLKISGNPRAGNVTFSSSGEIRIYNQLDISSLNFANNSYRFFTNGSTVRFCKNGGTQNVPLRPASPSDTVVYLEYYNLILDSAGTKILTATGTPTFKVLNNLTIDNGATFSANNFNLEVQGDWLNANGSKFIPGTGTVIFRNSNALTTTTITSRDTSDNPFNNVLIAGSGTVKAIDNIKIQGNITFASGSTFEMTNNFMSLYGNWNNLGGTFTFGTSTVSFNGTTTQNIVRSSGDANFYNLIVKNSSDVNILGVGTSGNGVIVNNNLTLTSGSIRARSGSNYRFVTVLGSLTRPGGGYIDGELRKIVPAGTTTQTFEVGYGTRYLPITIEFFGSGGTSGLLSVFNDTITTTTSPISWNTNPPTDILPTNSSMSADKHVARQYTISIPSGSTFALGSSRKYNATFTFVGAASPNGDLRNGANTNLFEVRLRSGSLWIGPLYYGTIPLVGSRTTNTTRFDSLTQFGTFIVGEPSVLTFYSRANGNWTNPSSWSTISYGGPAANEYPGQNTNNFRAYIGNNNTITLNQNISVNTVGANTGWVQVDSSGTLNFSTFVLSGTGEFRLAKDGRVVTENVDGFRASGALGSVQTTTRNFNYLNHNRGHFVYSGNLNQTQANEALPATIATLTINKSANTLTFQRSLTITDSLFIQSGSFSLTANLTISGNLRRNSGTTFNPNTTTITFTGLASDTITNLDSNPLNFYNLTLAKNIGTGDIVLSTNTVIQINNNLTFDNTGTNKSLINARTYSGAYVIMGANATVSNASNTRGWVNGELRKNIPSGDAPPVMFEIGDSLRYSPFYLDFASGTNNGTAGYLAARVIPGTHPYMDLTYNPPVAPSRLIGPKWWRLTQPQGSTFQRGNRNVTIRAYFIVPGDDAYVDYWGCVDLTYCRRWTDSVIWQPLYPNSTLSNDGMYGCNDTRQTGLTPSFSYSGVLASGLAYVQVANVNTPFGWTQYIGNDLLLGDFVSGNQNTIARFYNFYSIKDGDWTDPTTWSTVSLDDTLNPTNLAASDTTGGINRLIYGFPRRQYDNVIIGRGRKVRLDANIGTNVLTSVLDLAALLGPSVVVRDSGILDLNYHVLRGNSFRVYNGGKIIIGSASGITNGNAGNVNLFTGTLPSYSDSISIVYTAEGYTTDVAGYLNTIPNRNGTTHYLERVSLRRTSDNQLLMDNITLDTLRRNSQCINIYLHKKAVLTAGVSYYLQIDPSSSTGNRRYKAWIDYNRNGSYTDAGEEVVNTTSNSSTLFSTPAFIVPAGTLPGSTQMRVGMRDNTNDFGPNDAGTGEFEEYTIDIINNTSTVTQATGNGLPNILRSFEVHSPRNGSVVQLGKSITVLDSVRIRSGELQVQANNITLYGDFVNDTLNGFNAGTGSVFFQNSGRSRIRGSQPITFNNIFARKPAVDTIAILTNISINNTFSLDSSNIINLADGVEARFQPNGNLTFTGSGFSNKKMFRISGNANSGFISKYFTTGTNVTRTFTYPYGIDTVFNQANISITGNFTGTPNLIARLRNSKHPNRLNENVLKKYWTLIPSGITNVTANSLQFDFYGVDTSGNLANYIPGRYKTGSGWEINLGTNPTITPISYGYRIQITNDTTFNGSKIDGDFTAGEPLVYFVGRIFFSRNTGKWSDKLNWSNDPVLKHNGPACSYYPGQLYPNDTVNIDGHTIYFDLANISVDSIRIGGTNPNPPAGELRFDTTGNNKILRTRQLFLDNEAVRVSTSGFATPIVRKKIDTLVIVRNLINNAGGPFGMHLFPQYSTSDSDFVVLKFAGSGNSRIIGSGPWSSIRSIVLQKNGGLSDSLFNESPGLCNGSNSSAKHFFEFKGGILVQNNACNLFISGLDVFPITLGQNSGISVFNGSVRSRSSVTMDANTILHLRKGDFYVGEPYLFSSVFGSLFYNTGSVVRIDTGMLWIARYFTRAQTNSLANFTLNPLGTVKVNTVAMGSYPGTGFGFDISNSASTFNMSGGRIIVCNALGTSPSAFDLRINAQNGSGITGGEIQSGDTSLTPNNTIIKIGGTLSVRDLHFANSPSNSVTTQITEQTYTITGNWTIDANHNFNLNGNTVRLGGNLTNYGNFVGSPTGPTTDPWLLELNGNVNQILFSNNSPINLYNLIVNKTNGNVLLSASGTSNLIVRNTLEFSTGNNAFISAPIQSGRFVEVSPITGSNPTIIRNGKGHIFGRLYRHIGSGIQTVFFPVGADSINSYRPVWFQTTGSGNTPGLVGVLAREIEHPRMFEGLIDTSKTLRKFWKITSNGFALASGNSYNLTVQFLNPYDIKPGSNLNNFEIFRYTPPCPDPPTPCTGGGTWTRLTTTEKTDTTLKATGITQFGDFTAGLPKGVTFWSRNNGPWNSPTTWSWASYYVDSVPTRIPNQAYDIVRIGNNKVVTIPDGFVPQVMDIYVEKDSINKLPGTLLINGTLGYLAGQKFVLEDSCTLGVQNQYGIARVVDGNIGAVQTNVRNYGVARYYYNSAVSALNTGLGLPDSIKTLIIENTFSSNNNVYLSTYSGAPVLKIADTLLIRAGTFNAGNRNMTLYKVMILDSTTKEGKFEPTSATVTFDGANEKYLILKNRSGVRFNNLVINQGNLNITRPTINSITTQHAIVTGSLNFANPNTFITLFDTVNLKITNNSPTAIINFGSDRYVRTSLASGLLIRSVTTGQSYTFPIGSNGYYSPAVFDAGPSGASGVIGVRTSYGQNTMQTSGHIGFSPSTAAVFLKRYWTIDSVTATINGKWTFYYNDNDVSGTESAITKIGRWQPAFEKLPGSWSHPFNPSVINITLNTFETSSNFNYSGFYGDWTIGNEAAFRRIFFSRQSGLWSSDNSWTWSPTHSGPIAGVGLYPNSAKDSVVIGGGNNGSGNHEITLDISNPFPNPSGVGIAVGTGTSNTGTLNLGINVLNGEYFTMGDLSTLKIGSPSGITTVGNNVGNIQTSITRNYSTNGIYIYNGSGNQTIGNGLPSTVFSFIVNNTGTYPNNVVTIDKNITVQNDLRVLSGTLNLQTFSMNAQIGSLGTFELASNTRLLVGGTNNLATTINNYSNYTINTNSIIDFNGSNQVFTSLPTNLTQNFITNTGGLGTVWLSNTGIKFANSPLLIRGNLVINVGVTLQNSLGVDALTVRGSVINNAAILNQGVIEIGTEP